MKKTSSDLLFEKMLEFADKNSLLDSFAIIALDPDSNKAVWCTSPDIFKAIGLSRGLQLELEELYKKKELV